jgi:molecular chaperone DnaK (HSP70)
MPKIKELLKTKFKKDPNCSINPEEAVATGASIQAFMISNSDDPFSDLITIQDATALSLGIETIGGIMDIIIPKGSPIPALGNKLYSTDQDYINTITVKIYEGERSLTRYNFFVGEFDLTGIKPALRGIPEINVHIKIDENGIINVIAENMDAEDDTTATNSIVVTSHKGRLTQEQLTQFIEEAADMEARDELEKRRKLLHYELEDFCNNIIMNIKRDNNKENSEKIFKISDTDRDIILNDINGIINWTNENKYHEREDEDYTKILDRLKNRYGVLILKGSLEETKDVKQIKESTNATGIYEDEENNGENMEDIFEKIEEREMGIIGMSDTQKAEVKEIRKALSDLCYSINEVLDSNKLAINQEHIKELRDYIDDTLLWLYTHEQPSKAEYKMKIDEVNEQCDIVFKHYEEKGNNIFNKNAIIESIKNNRDELENLCLTLKLLMSDNAIPINKKTEIYVKELSEKINSGISWIYSKDEEENKNMNEYYSECEKRLNEINNLCDLIQQKQNGINIDENIIQDTKQEPQLKDIKLTGYIETDVENKEMGTSIIDIMRNKQKDVMLEMIQNNDEN